MRKLIYLTVIILFIGGLVCGGLPSTNGRDTYNIRSLSPIRIVGSMVGIGTSLPSATLDVVGNIKLSTTLTVGTLNGVLKASSGVVAGSADTNDLTEGSDNLYYTTARFDTRFATKDTDDLTEGSTNLYQLTEEEVEDYAGGMLGGTETHIAVTYQDNTNDIDFVVNPDSVAGSISAGAYNDDSVNDDDINWGDLTYLTTNGAAVDEAYASGWNSDVGPPEKDDVYDYLHNFDSDDDGSFADEAWLTAYQPLDADLTTLAGSTAWRLFYSNGSSVITELGFGVNRTFLEGNGLTTAPGFRGLQAGDIPDISATYEVQLNNEAGLYAVLSDVTQFYEDGDKVGDADTLDTHDTSYFQTAITGTDTHVMFFDGADTPAGEAGLTYNKTTNILTAASFTTSASDGINLYDGGYYLKLYPTASGLSANHYLQIDVSNADRILTLTGNATLNQDVTTTGTPTFNTVTAGASSLYSLTTTSNISAGGTIGFGAGAWLSYAGTVLTITGGTITDVAIGTGIDFTAYGETCVKDKLYFTQADKNEYIDSLADGYMDYGATTGHRFDARVDVADAIGMLERSSDPAEPAEGNCVIWMSDGTGKGDDGDVLIASKAGGTTNWGTLFDHSGGAGW